VLIFYFSATGLRRFSLKHMHRDVSLRLAARVVHIFLQTPWPEERKGNEVKGGEKEWDGKLSLSTNSLVLFFFH